MTSLPCFHACTSYKANMLHNDRHSLCLQCLGVQHATEAIGDEDICKAFQPRVCHNRLNRAMGINVPSPTEEPSAVLRAPPPLLQLSQCPSQEIPCAQAPTSTSRNSSLSPQARRVKRSRQTRDIMDFKAQMAQVLELLSRQQVPAAPVEVPDPHQLQFLGLP
ncbi:UNVERIFIED_CONTAM: hypothetical protein FKN15_055810 [Acipenser sinensis]